MWFWNNASQNLFYLNNFINNTENVEKYLTDFQKFPKNIWDNTTVGNFWSDYTGIDANEDGIGDLPYIIEENNNDNHPFMLPINFAEYLSDLNPTTTSTSHLSPTFSFISPTPSTTGSYSTNPSTKQPTPIHFSYYLIIGIIILLMIIVVSAVVFFNKRRKEVN